MNVGVHVSMFDGFATPYTLEQWVKFSPNPTGGQAPLIMSIWTKYIVARQRNSYG